MHYINNFNFTPYFFTGFILFLYKFYMFHYHLLQNYKYFIKNYFPQFLKVTNRILFIRIIIIPY